MEFIKELASRFVITERNKDELRLPSWVSYSLMLITTHFNVEDEEEKPYLLGIYKNLVHFFFFSLILFYLSTIQDINFIFQFFSGT